MNITNTLKARILRNGEIIREGDYVSGCGFSYSNKRLLECFLEKPPTLNGGTEFRGAGAAKCERGGGFGNWIGRKFE